MKPVTRVVIAIMMIAAFGFTSIVIGEYIREGQFDFQEVKFKLKRADLEIAEMIKDPIEYFSPIEHFK